MQTGRAGELLARLARHWRPALALLGASALALLFPFELTLVPEWDVRVSDEEGRPFAGARVFPIWDHRTLGLVGREERLADGEGRAAFPSRTARAGLLYRAWRRGRAALKTLGRGGEDAVRATVWASSPKGVSGCLVYEPGKPPPREVVLRR